MCLEKNMIRISTCLIIMHMVCSTAKVFFFNKKNNVYKSVPVAQW